MIHSAQANTNAAQKARDQGDAEQPLRAEGGVGGEAARYVQHEDQAQQNQAHQQGRACGGAWAAECPGEQGQQDREDVGDQ